LIFICYLTFTSNAFASGDPLAGADFEYGQYLSSQCGTCHRDQGATTGIPSLKNYDAEGFIYLLKAYRSKELENAVMQSVAGQLDDEQIASLALYFTTAGADN
jgi:cytochrome c